MSRKFIILSVIFFSVFCVLSTSTYSQTKIYTGFLGGDWNSAGILSLSNVSNASHDIIIPAGLTIIVDNSNALAHSVSYNNANIYIYNIWLLLMD